MCAAAARTVKKYSVPRNSLIPDQSLRSILLSDPLFKSGTGTVEASPMSLFHAAGDAGSKLKLQKRGVTYFFKHGTIYVYDEAKQVAAYAIDSAKCFAGALLPELGAELLDMASDLAREIANDKLNERNTHSQDTLDQQIATLESRGVVVLPGVDLVDLEHQVEPAGFMSKEAHRLVLTFEDRARQRNRYQLGVSLTGKDVETVDTLIRMAFSFRMWGELAYIFPMVKYEYAPGFAAIFSEMRTSFEQQHGPDTAVQNPAFAKEVDDRFLAETTQNGYTVMKGAQRALELLEPMREVYDKTPVLQEMMQNLRADAAGETK